MAPQNPSGGPLYWPCNQTCNQMAGDTGAPTGPGTGARGGYGGRLLLHRDLLQRIMRQTYYNCLMADERFREALAALAHPLAAQPSDDPDGEAASLAVDAFVRDWALPARHGAPDVRAA